MFADPLARLELLQGDYADLSDYIFFKMSALTAPTIFSSRLDSYIVLLVRSVWYKV